MLKVIDYTSTVGATSTKLLPDNPRRISATFINDSDETIYLKIGTDAVSNEGIRLNSSGGSYEISLINPWYGEVYAICSSGGKVLVIEEVTNAN